MALSTSTQRLYTQSRTFAEELANLNNSPRTMATTSLPPIGPLLLRNAKRTRDVFESDPDAGMMDDEVRYVIALFSF